MARLTSKSLTATSAVLALALTCGAGEPAPEYKVKAAFICNFARFIEWPSSVFSADDSPFVIAVVGDDPFKGALEQAVAGKKVGNRTVEIRHFDTVDKIGPCQILVVPATDDETDARIVRKVGTDHVLTVGESDDFCAAGGCVRFFTEENKIRFEINTDAAEKAGLKISSKLLKLARIFRQ